MTDENDGSLNRVWLRGFLRGVDCRPVQFRDALGTTLVCNLCGLVARRTASLRCSHVFCEFCFEQCTDGAFGEERRCIIDRDVFDVGTVRWNETRPLDLVKAKVRCWNARYGCDFTGPLRGLLDHFEQDCTFHAPFESKMNELLEHMRALGTRTSVLQADMSHAKETLERLLPEGATGEDVDLLGVSAGAHNRGAQSGRIMASGLEGASAARPLSRFFMRRRETCTLRVAFRKSYAEHSTEADLSSPLDPEVWTTRCETPDRTCNLKLVLLEDGTALSVYAAADQCVDVFNPWALRSVTFTSPRRLFPQGRPKLLTPTWLVSRQSRASLVDEGFERFRSRPLEHIFRRGFFFGGDEEVVVLTVKLVRKFDAL
ncbi:hypothetical protein MTO96_018828 [Rhipicephalus appendiculatus]